MFFFIGDLLVAAVLIPSIFIIARQIRRIKKKRREYAKLVEEGKIVSGILRKMPPQN